VGKTYVERLKRTGTAVKEKKLLRTSRRKTRVNQTLKKKNESYEKDIDMGGRASYLGKERIRPGIGKKTF